MTIARLKMSSLQILLLVVTATAVTSTNLDNGAIVNLTTAINQLLTQSTDKCPLTNSRDSLTDLMQLVFTKQLLSEYGCSSDEKLQKNIADLKEEISKMSNHMHSLANNITSTGCNAYETNVPSPSNVQHSCEDILTKWPSSPSGYYLIADVNGHVRQVYCHMETLCNKGGGWRRVAHLNMTDSDEVCPEQFRQYPLANDQSDHKGIRACGRPASSVGNCTAIKFPSSGFEYSEVCGKVIGYQFGIPDAGKVGGSRTIDSIYADGISLTHGSPRKHVWSFLVGQEDHYHWNLCPCGSSSASLPTFVGSHYYCEAGCHDESAILQKFYSDDRLWDGKDCGTHETVCCQRDLIPWFYRDLGYSTTDYIEMRICLSEGTIDEDSPVEQYEIYVK